MSDYITVDDARALLLSRASTTFRVEQRNLAEALGHVLGEDVTAPMNWPPFSRAAMDGYAVRAAHTPGTFQVTGTLFAGDVWPRPLAPGEALRIMTGAPVPEGADTVLEQERVTEGPVIAILDRIRAGRNVMPAAHEYRNGDTLLPAGTLLGPLDVGQLASVGISQVPIIAPPRVTIITTGDEIVPPGSALNPGQIYDANGHLLTSLWRSHFGADVRRVHVPDHRKRLITILERVASTSDLLITTGGVSVGAHDYLPALMEQRYQRLFWHVDMHPGKATAAALIGDRVLWLALSGNPGAMLTAWYLLGMPLAAQLSGHPWTETRVQGRLMRPYPKPTRETRYLKARFVTQGDTLLFDLLDNQSSDAIRSFREADGLVIIPHKSAPIKEGTVLDGLRLLL